MQGAWRIHCVRAAEGRGSMPCQGTVGPEAQGLAAPAARGQKAAASSLSGESGRVGARRAGRAESGDLCGRRRAWGSRVLAAGSGNARGRRGRGSAGPESGPGAGPMAWRRGWGPADCASLGGLGEVGTRPHPAGVAQGANTCPQGDDSGRESGPRAAGSRSLQSAASAIFRRPKRSHVGTDVAPHSSARSAMVKIRDAPGDSTEQLRP